MKLILVLLVGFLLSLAICQQPPTPPVLNGYRAVFSVGANEDLDNPAVQFGIDAITAVNGYNYSQIISDIYSPAVDWWLYRFGVDFTNAIELFYNGSGFFYNGYAMAVPVAADETYRVLASNIPVFNTLVPAKVYLVQYTVVFFPYTIEQLPYQLFYNGTYGNPNNQVVHPRIPILGGFPFFFETLSWGWYTVVTYVSNRLYEDTLNSACMPEYKPLSRKEYLKEQLGLVNSYPVSQVNFTFYKRSYDPNVGYPYYATPGRSFERDQMCSPEFGPGIGVINLASAFIFSVNGTFPTFFQTDWQFPMNASNAAVPELFGWNDCGCCQGCVPLTSFPPLTNPPGSSSSSGVAVLAYNNQKQRIDDYVEHKLKIMKNK